MTVAAPGKQSSVVTLKYDELVEDIQRELLATGHFQDMVDGVNGPKTRVAIELYQREHNLDIDGRPTAALLDHIRYTRKLAQAAEFTGSIEPLAEAGSRSLTVANGAHSLVQVPDMDSGQTDAVVWRVQERLARLGYGPDTRSGRLDPETVAAILKFELDHGLDMDGKLSKALLEAIDAAERQLAAQ